ncbi:MAG: SAM-dependent methyltransferase [Tunicatimonas sp.]
MKNTTAETAAPGQLFLIPSVIAPDTAGRVLPPQVLEVLGRLDYFLAENLRTSRRFISSLKLGRPIDQLHFDVLDKRTAPQALATLMAPLRQGNDVGILSEAGCPGVADPGALAVAYAHQHNITVVPLVGPSSFLLALMASGFSGQSFAFRGYLPIDKVARQKAVRQLEKEARQHRQTQIFMETPFRNDSLLRDVLSQCSPNTLVCVAKDITGPNEFIKTQTVQRWRQHVPALHKVPTVFLLSAS